MEKIIVICGTNRKNSLSSKIASLYSKKLDEKNCPNQLINLIDLPHDFAFSSLYEKAGTNEEFNQIGKIILKEKKFVFIVPEYNGTFPGILKTFIDGLQFPESLNNKKGALVGLSSGVQGAGIALSHLTDIFHYCGMEVLSIKPKLANINHHFNGAVFTNNLYDTLLNNQIEKFINF